MDSAFCQQSYYIRIQILEEDFLHHNQCRRSLYKSRICCLYGRQRRLDRLLQVKYLYHNRQIMTSHIENVRTSHPLPTVHSCFDCNMSYDLFLLYDQTPLHSYMPSSELRLSCNPVRLPGSDRQNLT